MKQRGFTLIEVLVVIGIIAILAAIVVVAINPARQFSQANNSQRSSNVNTLLNGIGQLLADHKGVLTGCPALTSGVVYTIAKTGTFVAPATAVIDMACLTPTYIAAGLPFDPSDTLAKWVDATDYNTGYNVTWDSTSGRYTVSAPSTQLPTTVDISVTR